jgi:hypothetical protein
MATTMLPDVTVLLQARSKWRGSVHLSSDIISKIDTIRAEIRSGEDPKGWQTVGTFRQAPRPGGRFGGIVDGNGSGGGYRSRFGGAAAPIPAPHPVQRYQRPPTTAASAAPTRYMSRFKNTEDTVENVVVNTIIQGKLNKFSVANYDDVREFLMEILATGDKEFLGDFMKLIFQKAATEPTFCGLYAKLLFELSSRFDFLRLEMDSLYAHFMNIFKEVIDGSVSMEAFMQYNKQKKYRLGYSQFIGELYKYGIVSDVDIINTIRTIVDQMTLLVSSADQKTTVEEYADCLLRMLRVMATGSLSSCVSEIRAACTDKLATLKVLREDAPGLTNKTRFTIMDVEKIIA